ncbi:GNAT family N-acetyltransferase [Microbacterium koreense]|uniref:GNAT family N-acetyltransferase n=1 Tax=Microbacterium koreense TaxID=323761 RepID=A0ABW2ZP31_9MICO
MRQIEVEIRPARNGEAREIGEVFDAAVLREWTYFADIRDMVPMFEPAFWEAFVADVEPPDVLLVAVDAADERVVGYVGTKVESSEVWVLFVRPESSGRGVGRRLLRLAEEAIRAAGCRHAILWTHAQNERAQRVYRAAGYVPDGETRTDEIKGHGFTEIRMKKPLTR